MRQISLDLVAMDIWNKKARARRYLGRPFRYSASQKDLSSSDLNSVTSQVVYFGMCVTYIDIPKKGFLVGQT